MVLTQLRSDSETGGLFVRFTFAICNKERHLPPDIPPEMKPTLPSPRHQEQLSPAEGG